MREKIKYCSICRRPIPIRGTWTDGNNAAPINNGRCCYVCNDTVVIPARIRRIEEFERLEREKKED